MIDVLIKFLILCAVVPMGHVFVRLCREGIVKSAFEGLRDRVFALILSESKEEWRN